MNNVNKLLGNPPDQITEQEKMNRLQEIADKMLSLDKSDPLKYFAELRSLCEEEHELDRKYPSRLE
jgi:hypothetical protein